MLLRRNQVIHTEGSNLFKIKPKALYTSPNRGRKKKTAKKRATRPLYSPTIIPKKQTTGRITKKSQLKHPNRELFSKGT